ncbi:LysM domain-containing protein [Streptomyces sp. NPDC029003]|uniref:LysM domain-containing protein n=1 Tax=Streptomyces sp. NPDC029003 TaxID=3155125 RepID=UPI0033FF2A45
MSGLSRYAGAEIATTAVADGAGGTREVRYLRRRPLPDPRRLAVLALHPVARGDRMDLVAARHLGDPTAFWLIADANGALDPDALVAPEAEGTLLLIPIPGV